MFQLIVRSAVFLILALRGGCSLVLAEETQTLDEFKILCCVRVPWIRSLGLTPS